GNGPCGRRVRPDHRPATRDPRRGRPLQDLRGCRRDDDGLGGDSRVGTRDPVRRPVHGRQLRPRDRGRTAHVRPHPRDAAEERGPHAGDRGEGRGATPMSLLIRDVQIDRDVTQIYIEGNRIVEIGKKREADTVIDGKGKIALPGFVNLHTHAAMTLFRGWGDDLDLSTWLETKIWPAEARLTPDDVYWGTKLACLEMVKTGTTTFNDMYFHMDAAAKAVKEMGLRAFLAEGIVDLNDPERAAKQLQTAEAVNRQIEAMKTDRITPVLGPHAIYSVSKDTLIRIREQQQPGHVRDDEGRGAPPEVRPPGSDGPACPRGVRARDPWRRPGPGNRRRALGRGSAGRPHHRRPAPAGAHAPPRRCEQLGLFGPWQCRRHGHLRRRRVDAGSTGPRRGGNPGEGVGRREGPRLEGLRWPSTGSA